MPPKIRWNETTKPLNNLGQNKKEMQITIISNEYPPLSYGGIGNTCRILIDALSKKPNFKINLITLKTHNDSLPEYESKGNLKIYRLNMWRLPSIFKPRLFFALKLPFFKPLKSIIAKSDVVHALNFRDVAFMPKIGKPLIVNIPDYYAAIVPLNPFKFPYPEKGKLAKYFNYQFLKLLDFLSLQKADVISCNSRFTENVMIQKYGLKHKTKKVVYKGVDLKKFDKTKKKDIDILFVGSRFEMKGAKELIYALHKVKQNYPSITCVMAGSSSLIDVDYNALISKLGLKENIKLIGRMENNKLRNYFLRSRIYYLGSYVEAFGQTLVEAMASKCAIITSDVGGIPEVVNPSCAILIKPGNVEQIVNGISNILTDKKGAALRVSIANKRAKRKFNSKKMINEYIKIYNGLIQ